MSEFKFWQEQKDSVSKAERDKFMSAAETGKRLVRLFEAVTARSLEDVRRPADLPKIDRDVLHYPHVALNEIRRIAAVIPQHIPNWEDKTPGQMRAWAVLQSLRATVEAAKGVEPEQALRLIEQAAHLGVTMARAHVEPWESTIDSRIRSERGLKKINNDDDLESPNQRAHIEAKEKHALWNQAAAKKWAANANLSCLAVAQLLEQDETLPDGKASTIRRHIHKPRK